MPRRHFKTTVLLIGCLLLAACAGNRRVERVEGRAGHFIPGYGFSIDARYDPKLDTLVPPYKLLTVAIRNTSLNVIRMDPRKDRWVLVDADGKKVQAINTLRARDQKRWRRLPDRMRELMDYPDYVPISYTATFNLFFAPKVALEDFRQLRFKNASSNLEFLIDRID